MMRLRYREIKKPGKILPGCGVTRPGPVPGTLPTKKVGMLYQTELRFLNEESHFKRSSFS